MSRETEKILKELQRFLDSHADEIKSEDDANALAEQFLAEYDQKCAAQQDHAPETADDYLDLAEQATSKKKHMEYLRKALELEPGSVPSAGFQRIQQKQPVQPQSGRKSRIPVLEGFRFLPSGQAAERRFRSERFPQWCRRARGVPASPSISAPGRYRFPCRKKNLPSMTEWNPADGL